MGEKVWNNKALHEMVAATGLTENDIADMARIPRGTFHSYVGGYQMPSLMRVWRLADLFGVTIDELIGRDKSDEGLAYIAGKREELISAMEKKMGKQAHRFFSPSAKKDGVGWPYNLLREVFGSWDSVVDEKQMGGLVYALSMLEVRWKNIVISYYKDGKTYEQIGKEIGITRERVRQLIVKSIRKMKNPVLSSYIMYGTENAEKKHELGMEKLRLDEKERMLKRREAELEERKKKMDMDMDKIASGDADIAVLGLSVRANNALHRGYRDGGALKPVDTISKLIDCASSGKLFSVRNIGNKTVREICDVLFEVVGVDYYETNKMAV